MVSMGWKLEKKKMKGDTLLDYAEFRLSQSRTRCELFVSAEGVTEKLASGFLKPFLTHLRIAEEQASRGLQNIRLECNQAQGNAWFTKGTIERFVRFVSTPEVLEQVKTIEDELIQLDFVHKMQIGDRPAHTDGAISKNDSKSRTAKPQERNDAQIMSRRHPFDIGNDEGEASKRELLRAMNVRLLALQQEQKKAFSRAAAAGFDRNNVADLLAFAENFGANRLHKVCKDFLTLFRKKHGANSELEGDSSTGEVSSSDSDMSLESGTGADLPGELEATSFGEAGNSYKITYGSCEETWESDTGERFINGPILKKQQNHTHGTRGWNTIEGRRACAQSENPYVNQHGHHPVASKGPKPTSAHKAEFIGQGPRENYSQVESRINNPQCSSSNSKLVYFSSDQGHSKSQLQNETNLNEESPFSQLREMAQKVEARRTEGLRERNRSMSAETFTCKEAQPENSENLDRDCKKQETSHFPSQTSITCSQQPLEGWAEPCDSDRSVTVHADTGSESFCKIPLSPKRSASPYLKNQTGSRGLKHQGSSDLRVSSPTFQEHCIHDSLRDQDSDCSASYAKDHGSSNLGADNNNLQRGSSTEPVRRLSVQDAISLFESKRRDSSDLPIKRLAKQESGKGNVESGNSSIPRKSVLRRWSGANELASELSSQQGRDSRAENQVATSKVQPDVCKPSHEDSASASTDETHDGLAWERSESKLSVIHLGDFREPITNVSSTFNISLQQEHILGPETRPSLETSDGHFQWKQQRAMCEPSSLVETDWGKQTKSETAKCLTKEVKSNDSETVVTSKFEDDNAEAQKNISKGKIMRMTEAGQTNLSQSINTGESGLEQGKTDLFADASETSSKNVQGNLVVRTSPQLLKQQSDIGSQTTSQSTLSNNVSKSVVVETSSITQSLVKEHLQKTVQSVNEIEPKVLSVQKVQTSRVTERSKEKTSIGAAGHSNTTSKIKHKGGKESSGSSQDNTSLDINLQALTDIVDRRHNNQVILQGDESCDTQRGKLYEHYNKLRDAKLRQEHVSKRAEREAKLKALAETLDRSKAEMKRTPRMSRKNNLLAQAQALKKSESLKSSLVTRHKKQEGEEEEETDQDEYQLHIQGPTNSSPTSPPLTPHAGNGVLVSKPHAVKKFTSQKSAVTPSSSIRVPNSLSPSMPKNPAANPSGPWRSAALANQASVDENPLARSAPFFADLRKENAKPSSKRSTGSRVHSKNNNRVGRQQVDTEATTPLESGGNASVLSSNNEDTRKTSVLMRKSCATIADLRLLSDQGQEDELLASLDVQKEGTGESKIRRSAVAPIQEAKPFLRKGQGIGPGAGPGVMKLKAAVADDTKSSDEETPLSPTLNAEDVPQKDVIEVSESIISGAGSEADISVINEELLTGHLPPMEEAQPEATEVLTLDSPPDSSENDKLDHTVSSPADSLQCKQENGTSSAPLSQLLAQTAADSEHNATSFTASSSFRVDSLQHERVVTPYSPTSSSLLQSGRISGRFSPPSVVALESPPGSPVSWNSSQIPYISEVDVVHGRRNWGNPHRPLIAVTQHLPKEPAKGLKRLLKFGRKSRASETAATDWVSASTTSEGDDDPDEARDLGSADDLLRRAKMQEKGFEFRNTNGNGDSYSNQDQGTIQSLRSSIPAPPAHFKLREDHLSGGTLLKAPRSFFSLSSFRSKGSEGKGR